MIGILTKLRANLCARKVASAIEWSSHVGKINSRFISDKKFNELKNQVDKNKTESDKIIQSVENGVFGVGVMAAISILLGLATSYSCRSQNHRR